MRPIQCSTQSLIADGVEQNIIFLHKTMFSTGLKTLLNKNYLTFFLFLRRKINFSNLRW